MNAEQEEEMRQIRVRQAELVKAELAAHKVCLVCNSISPLSVPICPVCHAYQWSGDPALISQYADEAAQSVFPITLGYAPTYSRIYRAPSFD